MKLLGLSYDFHDAAAALVIDGAVRAAIQEERLSHIKHDANFPKKAIASCLSQTDLAIKDIDYVIYYEDPMLKFDRIIYGIIRGLPRTQLTQSRKYLRDTLISWFRRSKFAVRDRIANELKFPAEKVQFVKHHQAHAASAFFCSPFDRATVVTLDGVGEYDTASVSLGQGQKLRRLWSVHYPDSIGLFYSALTAYLGFEINEGEYKAMGMAGFGEPVHYEKFKNLVQHGDGRFKLDQSYFNFLTPKDLPFSRKFVDLFGPPREPGSPFNMGNRSQAAPTDSVEAKSRYYADIAASMQRVTEEMILGFVSAAKQRTGINNVAMAGGVALNCLANGRIQQELGCDLYVHPAASDAGGALGAALYFHTCVAKLGRPKPLASPFLGSQYGDDDVRQALDEAGIDSFREIDNLDELVFEVAQLLASGAVVGWFQGRSEWGPRALGCRSILGNPTLPEMQRVVNEKIKFREPFRPFAPAVLAERAEEYFEISTPRSRLQPETFMLSVSKVRPDARHRIPAVTHVDGTARLQLVWKEPRSRFRHLLEAFDRTANVPILLNTSFNRRSEPIVETPADALNTFLYSGLDYLVINNCLVRKESIE